MLLELAGILAPIFVIAGLGFLWSRRGLPHDPEATTALIMNIGAPCLVFSQLVSLEVERAALLQMGVAAIVAITIFAILGSIFLRIMRWPAHTFLGPLMFGNAGNTGLPLCLFSFGSAGLALATPYFAVAAIAHYTVGLWIWSGRVSLKEILTMPLSYAAVLSVVVLSLEVPVPTWLHGTTQLLGGLTIPLMLLTLGMSLGRLRMHRVPRTLVLALVRLSMGFAVGVGLSQVLGFEGVARGVLIIECSMPVAVFNYILAERYNRSPEEIANLVVVSTLIAFALLPVLLAWLL